MGLSKEDETLITRAVLVALGKWTAICFAIGIMIGLVYVIATSSGGTQ